MEVLRTVAAARVWRARPGSLGLVPTMGALHEGHAALVDRAVAESDRVVASIFVNPTQFGPAEDLAAYPRDVETDLALLEAHGCEAAFVPDVAEIYPPGDDTQVVPGRIADRLEGAARRGHFTGVATVVTKLIAVLTPDRAYFGQKDYQQLQVVRSLVRDLRLATRIVPCPTVREPSGLARSSRNRYLNAKELERAAALSRGLESAQRAFAAGERDTSRLRTAVTRELETAGIAAEYISVADPFTLEELAGPIARAVISLAARVGPARLIDNALVGLTLEDLDQS